MPRPPIPDNFASIKKSYRNRPEQIRLRALELLHRNPAITHQQVAAQLGVSKPTIDRWWGIYRKSGIEGLLAIGKKKRGAALPTATAASALPDSESLLRLMNAMPLSLHVGEAIMALRNELLAILPDVDRVVISVDTACDLINPEKYRPDLDMVQDVTPGARSANRVSIRNLKAERPAVEAYVDLFRRQGYPVDDYHPPTCFEIHYEHQAALGTVQLWRELSKPVIAQSTIDIVEKLLPFLRYALSNIVARHSYLVPAERPFREAIRQMAKKNRLTLQERRVVAYRLYGHSYKVIADKMDVSEDTIKKHLGSVHRKTKTSGHAELFAKYFAPLILPKSDSLE